MDDGHVIPEEIRGLLERRTTFQEWLSRLDQLGSEFRPEVASKVRGDYEGRLREVETELEGHRTELETALAGRQAAVEEAAGRHDARAAELEECELRHRVGEFDDAEWEHRRSEHQSVLDELDEELTTQRAAVGALEAVLGELVGPDHLEVPEGGPAGAEPVEAVEAHDAVLVEPAVGGPDELDELEAFVEEEGEAEPWASEPFETGEDAAGRVAELESEAEKLELLGEQEAGRLRPDDFTDVEEVRDEEAGIDEGAVEDAEVVAEGEAEPDAEAEPVVQGEAAGEKAGESGEFMDELEFLESLSLEDAESFDAVSAMLDEEEGGDEEDSERKPEDT